MKRILICLMVMVFVFSISSLSIGCKQKAEEAVEKAEEAVDEGAEEEVEAREEVELRMVLTYDWVDFMDPLARAYESKNPSVKIVTDVQGDLILYKETAAQIFASDDRPDIAFYWVEVNSAYPIMLKNDILEPLDSVYEENGLEEVFSQSLIDLYRDFGHTDGSYYGVPLFTDYVGILWYNKDIFKELGIDDPEFSYTSLDEFYDICEKLKDGGYEPLTAGLLEGWITGHIRNIQFQRNIPSEKLNDLKWNWTEGSEAKYHYNDDPDVLAAHEIMVEWADKVFSEGSLARAYAEGRAPFIQQKAAMYEDGSWGQLSIINEEPDFEFGCFLPPQTRDDVKPKVLDYSGGALVVPRGAKNADVAKDFISFVVSEEGVNILLDYGKIPLRSDLDTSMVKEKLGHYSGGLYELAQNIGTDYIYDSCLPAEFANKSFTLLQDMMAKRITPEDCCNEMENIADSLRKGE